MVTKAKAAQKVYNSYLKELKPDGKKSEGWESQYGAEATAWLKEQGFTILLVEQNFRFAAPLADRHYVIEHGRIVETVTMAGLAANMDKLHVLLGV